MVKRAVVKNSTSRNSGKRAGKKSQTQWQVVFRHQSKRPLKSPKLAASRAAAKLSRLFPGQYTTVTFSFGAFVVIAHAKTLLGSLPRQFGQFTRSEPSKTPIRETARPLASIGMHLPDRKDKH